MYLRRVWCDWTVARGIKRIVEWSISTSLSKFFFFWFNGIEWVVHISTNNSQNLLVLLKANGKTHRHNSSYVLDNFQIYQLIQKKIALLASDIAIWFSFQVSTSTSCLFWGSKLNRSETDLCTSLSFAFPSLHWLPGDRFPPAPALSQNLGVSASSFLCVLSLCIWNSK